MFHGPAGHVLLEPWHIELIALSLVVAALEEKLDWMERLTEASPLAYAAALAGVLFALEVFGVIDASIPFIYFQF